MQLYTIIGPKSRFFEKDRIVKTYAVGDIHGAYKVLIQCFNTKKYWQSDLSPDLYGGTPDRL